MFTLHTEASRPTAESLHNGSRNGAYRLVCDPTSRERDTLPPLGSIPPTHQQHRILNLLVSRLLRQLQPPPCFYSSGLVSLLLLDDFMVLIRVARLDLSFPATTTA